MNTHINTNRIPRDQDHVLALSDEIIDGLSRHGETLPLPAGTLDSLQTTQTHTQSVIQQYLDSQGALGQARQRHRDARRSLQHLVTTGKNFLRGHLGSQWSSAWQELGFVNGSLAHPKSRSALLGIGKRLQSYLEKHPGHEAPATDFTAIQAGAVVAEMEDAESHLNQSKAESKRLLAERKQALTDLKQEMRHVRSALATALANDNPLWLEFGFYRPIDTRIPEVPQAPRLVRHGELTLLQWEHATRARRYRIWRQRPAESNPIAIATVKERQVALESVETGDRLTLTALNAVGQSRHSEPVEVPPLPVLAS